MSTLKELKAELAALKAKIDAYEEPKPVGRVALTVDEAEWVLTTDGGFEKFNERYPVHLRALTQGNCFTTRKAAEQARDRRELIQKMRVVAAGSSGADKCFPFWTGKTYLCEREYDYTYSQLPRFASSGSLDEFMQTLTPDQQRLLICGVV